MLNDLSLQIIENALTKLSSASMGLSLFLEIIENIYNKKDWICWRRFINNDKEQQWCLWLTNSTKPSLHLKIGCFSSAQENKANVLLNFSERETAILSRGDIKILPNMRKSTLNKDKVRMHTKKSTREKKKKITLRSLGWIRSKTYKARQFKAWHTVVSFNICMFKVFSYLFLFWINLILKAFSLSWT